MPSNGTTTRLSRRVNPEEIEPGQTVGNYVVHRILSSGGFGIVYAAEHSVIGRRAAIKVLRRQLAHSDEWISRFVREARVVNAIGHPNIVEVYDFGRLADGRPYQVMELLDGNDLDQILRTQGTLSLPRVCFILRPVCGALEAAHRFGVVHRDIKPSNVMIDLRDPPRWVKLLDFGIAKLIDRSALGVTISTPLGQRLGSRQCMAPEQIRGTKVDARTDVYALGVVVFRLLTGRAPFEASEAQEVERMHLMASPPRVSAFPAVPPAVDEVVLRCLEKTPERRFATARDFMAGFEKACADD